MARAAIIGLGLIGGSIAAGLKKNNSDLVIMAWDQNPESLERGFEAGLIDLKMTNPRQFDAEIVILALPAQALEEILSSFDFGDATVTDVCSVKLHVLDTFEKVMGAVPKNFVPGHPIAGSEKHGVAAANPDLFLGYRVILTPTVETDKSAIDEVVRLWQDLGATITFMTPEHHDQILAQTSHLPHLLAYALVDTLSRGGDSLEVFKYAAGGFRDFSRIAASDPVMWRDIFLTNKEPVLEILDNYNAGVSNLRRLISEGDGAALETIFARAKAVRNHFSKINLPDD